MTKPTSVTAGPRFLGLGWTMWASSGDLACECPTTSPRQENRSLWNPADMVFPEHLVCLDSSRKKGILSQNLRIYYLPGPGKCWDQETTAFVQKGPIPRSKNGSEPKHDYKCPISSPSLSFLSLSGSQSARWTHTEIRCAWEMQSSVPAFQTEKALDPSGGICSLKISYLEGHLGGSVS